MGYLHYLPHTHTHIRVPYSTVLRYWLLRTMISVPSIINKRRTHGARDKVSVRLRNYQLFQGIQFKGLKDLHMVVRAAPGSTHLLYCTLSIIKFEALPVQLHTYHLLWV